MAEIETDVYVKRGLTGVDGLSSEGEQPKLLFHVTPISNRNGIRLEGITPRYARGKRKVTYWVERERLSWAIIHVSARHGISTENLIVYQEYIDPEWLRGMSIEGVYYVNRTFYPESVWLYAKEFAEGEDPED